MITVSSPKLLHPPTLTPRTNPLSENRPSNAALKPTRGVLIPNLEHVSPPPPTTPTQPRPRVLPRPQPLYTSPSSPTTPPSHPRNAFSRRTPLRAVRTSRPRITVVWSRRRSRTAPTPSHLHPPTNTRLTEQQPPPPLPRQQRTPSPPPTPPTPLCGRVLSRQTVPLPGGAKCESDAIPLRVRGVSPQILSPLPPHPPAHATPPPRPPTPPTVPPHGATERPSTGVRG